jgi:predicted component of type VI protein secretion system
VTKEQQEQLRLIIGNAAMKKDIQEVSDKLNSFQQTMQTDLATLKNTSIEMNRDINKKFLQLKTTVQKTGVKKTKDNI